MCVGQTTNKQKAVGHMVAVQQRRRGLRPPDSELYFSSWTQVKQPGMINVPHKAFWEISSFVPGTSWFQRAFGRDTSPSASTQRGGAGERNRTEPQSSPTVSNQKPSSFQSDTVMTANDSFKPFTQTDGNKEARKLFFTICRYITFGIKQ